MQQHHRHGAAALALAATLALPAWAGQHHVCYQLPNETVNGVSRPMVLYACSDDSGAPCVVGSPNGTVAAYAVPGVPQVTNWQGAMKYAVYSTGDASATLHYGDGTTRRCTVAVQSTFIGTADADAVLVGFNSDSSGLVSTAVWKRTAPIASTRSITTVRVPYNYVVTGGGVTGTAWRMRDLLTRVWVGALIVESAPASTYTTTPKRAWRGVTMGNRFQESHANQVYAIGLHIEGVNPTDLSILVGYSQATSTGAVSQPSMQVGGTGVRVGGGASANASVFDPQNAFGQYLTSTALSCRRLACYWLAQSKDHDIPDPGSVTTHLVTLPATLVVGGQSYAVQTQTAYANSGTTDQSAPSAQASGLNLSGFALTGIGAYVDWMRFDAAGMQTAWGSMLWALEPKPAIGGALAGAREHYYYSPAKVHAYAMGVRLVPAP